MYVYDNHIYHVFVRITHSSGTEKTHARRMLPPPVHHRQNPSAIFWPKMELFCRYFWFCTDILDDNVEECFIAFCGCHSHTLTVERTLPALPPLNPMSYLLLYEFCTYVWPAEVGRQWQWAYQAELLRLG